MNSPEKGVASSHVDAALPAHKPPRGGAAAASGRELALWRGAAIVGVATAAGLLVYLAFGPPGIVPASAPSPTGRYVAAVDSTGREPALIVELATDTGTFRVRNISAQVPLGRSLQLWHFYADGSAHDIALLHEAREWQVVEGAALRGVAGSHVEVTVEPDGGSPSGAPTGPTIYSGRLTPLDQVP